METRPIYVGQLTVDELRQILREEREERSRPAEPDRWLNADEAAAYIGMSKSELHKLTAERKIPFSQLTPRGKLKFRRAELDSWMEKGNV